MKNWILLFALLIGSYSFSQEQDFKSFDEDSYQVGDEIILAAQLFQHGAHKLMPEHYKQITRIADFLEKNRKVWVEIYCYSNETSEASPIEELCKKRAKDIYDRLVLTHNIAPKRLTVKGYMQFAGLAGGVGSQKLVLKVIKA